MKLTSDLDRVCVAKAIEAGQGHVFDGWDDLSPQEQQSLLSQLEGVDFQLFRKLVQQHIHTVAGPLERRALKPAPLTPLPDPDLSREDYEFSRNLAEYALRSGEVLIVTAAGGGGLGGCSEPLGFLPVGPVSGKSIFQLYAEKILALNKRHRISLNWSIFCHPAELQTVSGFFKARSYFGLKSSTVSFVPQSILPVVDRRGKIILEGKGKLAMRPSGHGSILLKYVEEEALEALERSGIRHIFYHQIDNPLVRIVDPAFLGVHIKSGSEVSSKAVLKASPEESVGVFCQYNDSIGVVEYMELGSEDREARLPDGGLAFSAANIGVHLFSVEFLRRMREEGLHLPFHAIELKTASISRRGLSKRNLAAKPGEASGLGFKAFVFDALPLARRAIVARVEREDEFSPIKNPTGHSSIQTAQRDLSRMYARWLWAAGYPLPEATGPNPQRAVEISPLFALDPEELRRKTIPGIPAAGDILLGGTP